METENPVRTQKYRIVVYTCIQRVFCFDAEFFNMEDDGPLQMAWSELSFIEKEQEQYAELRASTEHELEDCRQRGAALENVMQFATTFILTSPDYYELLYNINCAQV